MGEEGGWERAILTGAFIKRNVKRENPRHAMERKERDIEHRRKKIIRRK